MFDQYFDNILYSEHESRLKDIIQNMIAGVYNFVQDGDSEQAIQMMKIGEDFKNLCQNEYYYILSKVYA
jgi:hypothetical protein